MRNYNKILRKTESCENKLSEPTGTVVQSELTLLRMLALDLGVLWFILIIPYYPYYSS